MPNLWSQVEPLFSRVRATGEPIVDLDVSGRVAGEAEERHFLASVFAVRRAGTGEHEPLTGLGAIVVDITERKRVEQQIELLARASNLFLLDLTFDDAVDRVARLALPTFADCCIVYLPTRDGPGRRATVAHAERDTEARLRSLSDPLQSRRPDGPTTRALRDGAVELLEVVTPEMHREDALDDDHAAFLDALDARSAITVPLALADRIVGAITLLYTGRSERGYRARDVAVARELGRRIAQVLDNARLASEAARATGRLQLLARVGELLQVELDLGQRLRRVAQIMLPELADGSGVYLLDRGRLRLVAAGHPDPAVQAALEQADLPVHDVDEALPPCEAVRTRRAVLVRELAADAADTLSGGLRMRPDDGGSPRRLRSYLAVPLIGADGPIGAVGLGYSDASGRRYDADDIPVALEIARRVTPAVVNAKRYEGDRETIEVLQRTLLPAALPHFTGASITGRYIPGAAGLRIGGDWYDALVLADGTLFLAIGDVVGHGVRAAASMGRMRNALEIFAIDSGSPAGMLTELNRHCIALGDADMATVGALVYDPVSGGARFASAGHPPPVVREPGGTVRFVDAGRGMPIAASPRAHYDETETTFAPGSTLLLYTDGLVERRTESLDDGFARLAAAVAAGPEDVDALADHVLRALVEPDEPNDDVALLVVHFDRELSQFTTCVPADPHELARVRRSLADWLERVGSPAIARDDIVVCANEAASNAMEHAYGPVDAVVELSATVNDLGVCEVRVRDFGSWRPDRPAAGGGRGLTMIRNLMDAVSVDTTIDGTTVHMSRALHRDGHR
jgi:serine phosphatase RsbU (regulator of sigma subunit)/anti-sigma regulatory factor (Ser/Thr protein kinase)